MEFFEPTETKKISLIYGYIYKMLIVFLVGATLACSAQRDLYKILVQGNLQTEGFLAPDTFQVKGYGRPLPTDSKQKPPVGLKARHRLSFKRGIRMVRGRAVQMLYQHSLNQKQQEMDILFVLPPPKSQKFKNYLHKLVTNHGRIVASEFNSAGGCRVVMRIQRAELKQHIESLLAKYTPQGS